MAPTAPCQMKRKAQMLGKKASPEPACFFWKTSKANTPCALTATARRWFPRELVSVVEIFASISLQRHAKTVGLRVGLFVSTEKANNEWCL